jgi:hypothetical protein
MTLDKLVITLVGAAFSAIAVAFVVTALHADSAAAVLFSIMAAALSAFQPRALGWVEVSDNFKLGLLAAVVALVVGVIAVVFQLNVAYCAGISFYCASLVMQITAVHIENHRNKRG